MKLYSMVPQDCSGKVRWLLHELNLPFEEVRLSYQKGDLKTNEYRSKQPLGQVPVLEDNGITIYESYAIVHYLADKYGQGLVAPHPDSFEKKAEYIQWLFFSANSVENFIDRYFKLPKMDAEYNQKWKEYTHEKLHLLMGTIEKQLAEREYILGAFSAVDTCLGYALDAVSEEEFLSGYPNTRNYLKRLSDRPACLKSEIFRQD